MCIYIYLCLPSADFFTYFRCIIHLNHFRATFTIQFFLYLYFTFVKFQRDLARTCMIPFQLFYNQIHIIVHKAIFYEYVSDLLTDFRDQLAAR